MDIEKMLYPTEEETMEILVPEVIATFRDAVTFHDCESLNVTISANMALRFADLLEKGLKFEETETPKKG